MINTLFSVNLWRFLFILPFFVACKKEDTPIVLPPSIFTGQQQYGTPFAGIPPTSDLVIYEINERAFSTSGDFKGILPRLDAIKSLGVNTIWLMPIHPIGAIKTVNSPYCIRNFQEVNPEYGTLEDLRTLVNEAHKRNMAVILDWAANHTSWDNPWIQNTAWYSQDAAGNIIHPAGTNWQDVADLNFNNQAMRQEMIKSLKYWVLNANIDGYRCDAADYIPFDFWKQALDSLKAIPNRQLILLAEGARQDHFAAGFQMNFGWDFYAKTKDIFTNNQSANVFKTTHQNEYNSIPAGSHKMRFTSNHDECAWDDTPLGIFGGKQASLSAFVVTAFMGGVPLLYNGQEVGCPVKLPFFSRSPIDWSTNPDMFETYKWLMSVRAAHPALRSGDLVTFPDNEVAAFRRRAGSDDVIVLANTRNNAQSVNIPADLQQTTWKNAKDGSAITLSTEMSLSAFQYLILTK